MGHAEVNGADAELGSAGGDRTGDLERGLALVICEHLSIQTRQPVRRSQRLCQRFLRCESGGLRRDWSFRLSGGEDPPNETGSALYRLGESIDVTDVDANPNDHARSRDFASVRWTSHHLRLMRRASKQCGVDLI